MPFGRTGFPKQIRKIVKENRKARTLIRLLVLRLLCILFLGAPRTRESKQKYNFSLRCLKGNRQGSLIFKKKNGTFHPPTKRCEAEAYRCFIPVDIERIRMRREL